MKTTSMRSMLFGAWAVTALFSGTPAFANPIGQRLQQDTYYQAVGSIHLFDENKQAGNYVLDPLSYIYFGNDGVFRYKFNTNVGKVEGTQTYDGNAFNQGSGDLQLFTSPAGPKFGTYTGHGLFTPTQTGFASPTVIASAMRNLYRLDSTDGSFTIWNRQFTTAGAILGGTDFWLKTGSDISSQVPEPMTMSLLASGLLGGAVMRKKRARVSEV